MKNIMAKITQNWQTALFSLWSFNQSLHPFVYLFFVCLPVTILSQDRIFTSSNFLYEVRV